MTTEKQRKYTKDYMTHWRADNLKDYRAYQRAYHKKYRLTAKNKEYYEKYYQLNGEKIRAYNRAYDEEHKEARRLKSKEYYRKHRVVRLQQNRDRYIMNKSKIKGTRGENLVVSKLKEVGIPAERVPMSGLLGGNYKSDIAIPSVSDRKLSVEVKYREGISDRLWAWKEGVDILVVKKNQRPLLAIVDWDILAAWINYKLNGEIK